MIKIKLPWPARELSPNVAMSWRAKMRYKKEARVEGKFLTQIEHESFQRIGDVRGIFGKLDLQITLVFHPPDKRKRDLDNIFASMKSYLDGVCDALEIDDKQFKRAILSWDEPIKKGKVMLKIEVMK